MKRSTFLKSAAITSGAIITGAVNPLKAFSRLNNFAYIDVPRYVITYFPLIASYSNQMPSSCDCSTGSCTKNTPSSDVYYNPSYLWYILRDNRISYHANLRDPFYDPGYLANGSVPFFTNTYLPIMRLDGPSLLGLCFALRMYNDGYNPIPEAHPKDYLIPTEQISNAGYRFDTQPCEETKYKTKLGTTRISYNRGTSQAQSTLEVVAEDANQGSGLIYHSKKYRFSI